MDNEKQKHLINKKIRNVILLQVEKQCQKRFFQY